MQARNGVCQGEKSMSTKENKALARHWFAEGWNKGNATVADVIFSPHFTLNGIEVGIEGPKKNVVRTRRGNLATTASCFAHLV